MISFEQLQTRMFTALRDRQPQLQREVMPCVPWQSAGRVLAADLYSEIDLPGFNVSAMDGYGLWLENEVAGNDTGSHGTGWQVTGEAAAGQPFHGSLQAGSCIRIMTGAPVPDTVNTVVMQENVVRQGDRITLRANIRIRPGQNIRQRGEEIRAGEKLLEAGHRLSSADVLMLASTGNAGVTVYAPLRIGVVSTGDELAEPGQALASGQIYDANRPYLMAELLASGATVTDLGCLPDQPAALEAALLTAAAQCDVIISSGAVSVGDYDFLVPVLEKIGQVASHKVAMKPGKPFLFGFIDQCVFFGLPGNPLSTYIGFTQLVAPLLPVIEGGRQASFPPEFMARLTRPVKKGRGRLDFQRATLTQGSHGREVTPCPGQESHRVKELARADVLLKLPAERDVFECGEWVTVIPLPGCGTGDLT